MLNVESDELRFLAVPARDVSVLSLLNSKSYWGQNEEVWGGVLNDETHFWDQHKKTIDIKEHQRVLHTPIQWMVTTQEDVCPEPGPKMLYASLHHCPVLSFPGYCLEEATGQYYSTAVLQYCSTILLQYYSTVVLQYSSNAVLHYYSTAVLQYYSTAISQY